ncbi:MAG TPA: DUF3487 family protein [Gammaproteobacteria bacterium]|nr:DUF3487 family protein [Gammaproteobacteria bacterium]
MTAQTAHLIDDDPELFMGCSSRELKYIALASLSGSLVFWLLLFFWFGWYLALALVPAIFSTALASWRLANWIGKKKRGKPSRYHLQWLQIHWLPGKNPYYLHRGAYRIGRTHAAGPKD